MKIASVALFVSVIVFGRYCRPGKWRWLGRDLNPRRGSSSGIKRLPA